MIRKADHVLGTDHSEFVNRAIRGFQGKALDPHQLVPYAAIASIGEPSDSARGCGNSYVSLFSPAIWPEPARKWYDLYSQYFWQESWTCVGFREFPNDIAARSWYIDVDAGPVLKGFGCAACAFGMASRHRLMRANGSSVQACATTRPVRLTCSASHRQSDRRSDVE